MNDVIEDMTERTRAEVAVRASEVRYRRLFETAQDAILILDGDSGKIIDSNPFLSDLLGYSSDELRGKELWQIGLFRDIAASRAAFRQLQKEGYIRYEDLPLETKDSRRAHVEFVSNVYEVEGRQVIQCNIRDISDRKRAEEALREADRHKEEFLAMLAHELRNPLAALRNATEILRLKGTDDAEVRWAGDVVERQVQQLTRLVDDLLDISRFNQGKINLRMEPVALAAAVARAVEISHPLIDAHKHSLEVSLPEQALWVRGDMTRLTQVLSNLLNNAAKYTPERGRIFLTVNASGREAVLRVRDTGAGIAADMLPRIFEMFTQLRGSLSRSEGGLGIGLTLVRKLVEMHGGRVEAHSAGAGHGSEFIVRLPVLREAPLPAAAETEEQRPRKVFARNILIVDNNPDAVESLAILLGRDGHELRTATGGSAALDLARARPPDVVLLDIGMPGMDGLEVARRLRHDIGLKQTLLVALTGYGGEDDRRRSQDAGFDAHLVKPIDMRALEHLLAFPAFAGQASVVSCARSSPSRSLPASNVEEQLMVKLRQIEQDMLATGKVDGPELERLRRALYAHGPIKRPEADFLVELHKRVRHLTPSFEHFFYQAIKDHILAQGRIDDEEAAWLRQMLSADGKIDDEERKFLHELKGEAKQISREFEVLFEESMKQPPEQRTCGG